MSEDSIFSENDDDSLWGGANNEIILPEANIIAAILGILPPPLPIPSFPIQPAPPPQLSPRASRVRGRDETHPLAAIKSYRDEAGNKIIKQLMPYYSYLRLKSGDEFTFTEADGKGIILTEELEPNRLIRNIISRIPHRVSDRLLFLAKFRSEEESEEEESEGEDAPPKRFIGDLKEAVYEAYIKEFRLRFIFKKLLMRWRITKMNKTAEKEVDPITLSEPEKEVEVYDWANKRKFIFDAKSLATLIETKLLYQEYGFPVPMLPKNPKNNVEFTYSQLISIYNQLKEYGELRWGLITLREYNFNKNRWHLYHKSALTLNSIKMSIASLETVDARELLSDFIFAKMDDLGIKYNNYVFNVYQVAIAMAPKHWYLEKLKALANIHYEAEHFGHNKSKMINANCLKIFRKQTIFINDLKAKNII